ncbi:MAG: hypothetical protein Q7S00_03340 [bacterium]|nr:hypothetical protein [bacterium]
MSKIQAIKPEEIQALDQACEEVRGAILSEKKECHDAVAAYRDAAEKLNKTLAGHTAKVKKRQKLPKAQRLQLPSLKCVRKNLEAGYERASKAAQEVHSYQADFRSGTALRRAHEAVQAALLAQDAASSFLENPKSCTEETRQAATQPVVPESNDMRRPFTIQWSMRIGPPITETDLAGDNVVSSPRESISSFTYCIREEKKVYILRLEHDSKLDRDIWVAHLFVRNTGLISLQKGFVNVELPTEVSISEFGKNNAAILDQFKDPKKVLPVIQLCPADQKDINQCAS